MKKFLCVSLVAMFAAMPMLAFGATDSNATSASSLSGGLTFPQISDNTDIGYRPAYTNAEKYFNVKDIDTADANKVATAKYVKGAYNDTIRAINKETERALDAEGDVDGLIKNQTLSNYWQTLIHNNVGNDQDINLLNMILAIEDKVGEFEQEQQEQQEKCVNALTDWNSDDFECIGFQNVSGN